MKGGMRDIRGPHFQLNFGTRASSENASPQFEACPAWIPKKRLAKRKPFCREIFTDQVWRLQANTFDATEKYMAQATAYTMRSRIRSSRLLLASINTKLGLQQSLRHKATPDPPPLSAAVRASIETRCGRAEAARDRHVSADLHHGPCQISRSQVGTEASRWQGALRSPATCTRRALPSLSGTPPASQTRPGLGLGPRTWPGSHREAASRTSAPARQPGSLPHEHLALWSLAGPVTSRAEAAGLLGRLLQQFLFAPAPRPARP